MKRLLSTGKGKIIVLCIALATILVARLFVLTVVENEHWDHIANNISIKGIYTPSPRGSIYDRNGKLLAGSKQIFTVKMSAGELKPKVLNSTATKLINILDKNGDKYEDNFPIRIKHHRYYYTFDLEKKKWLRKQGISTHLSAEKAFNALRSKLGIPPGDRFEIQRQIQEKYNIYPPISVRNMKYHSDLEKEEFLKTYKLNENTSAKKAFEAIRRYYELDEKLSVKDARPIMIIRNSLQNLGYRQYLPADIAKDVSGNTVMHIEENREDLPGVEVISETKRFYPMGNRASHVIGYIGKISNEEIKKYEAKGYSPTALVGKEGIEGNYESVLKGRDGTRTVSVDNRGRYVATLAKIPPRKGKDIYLTIDSNLQKVAEEALEKNVNAIRWGGVFGSEFGSIPAAKMAPKAKSGAVVAIDVKTGDVLASASYPDYNLNRFSEGISPKNWQKLQSDNPRDSLAPAPLYNIATKSALQPGSTFKPITAITAIECGLDPTRYLYDAGAIKMGNRTFACVVWNMFKKNHGALNMYRALEVSCNYYFYDIATGKDWASGNSLGFKKKITIDKITNMARDFGLGRPTGIEIPETVVPVPSEEKKLRGLKRNLSNELYANAENFFTKAVYSNRRRLKKDVETIVGWMTVKNITREQMYNKYLPSVGVKKSKYEKVTNLCLYTYFNQAKWNVGDAFNIAIGQGENSYTPLQMANYVATLGNKGVRNKVSIIKSIEDRGPLKKPKGKKVHISSQRPINEVLIGMKLVATGAGSTISKHYKKFPWQVAAKTGTAQRSGRINPKSEVNYIKSHLSSFGNMSWKQVKKEMKRLMEEYPDTYLTEDTAVRRAVINLSRNRLSVEDLDVYKGTYDEFAWVVALAPADDPKIAVAAMIVQGNTAANANPVVREVIGQYLKKLDTKEKKFKDFKIVNTFD